MNALANNPMVSASGLRLRRLLVVAIALLLSVSGCRQKMADQPAYRPYEACDMFEDGRSARTLERGVIHRAQRIDSDPLITGLTREEWARSYEYSVPPKPDAPALTDEEAIKHAIGAPRYDPRDPAKPRIYATDYPFTVSPEDLKRGQDRYTIYCAVCHGPLGNGQGKIWERGYLTPTSFHTEKLSPEEVDAKNPRDIPLGYSRGFATWGISIPMRDVPNGYYFEVVTKGFGGMPSYSAQIPPPDRWKIIAYIRVLQLSQRAPKASLTPELQKRLDDAGGTK